MMMMMMMSLSISEERKITGQHMQTNNNYRLNQTKYRTNNRETDKQAKRY